ncbi:YeiH family protein [Convivina praedatoris]|uniref:Sulfate exporter family transporter n=1 Tax=Convivina praedatoris TaxID=2880963 RepID=A0ABN8H940_9LACO|nr:putative sulfate exporter family transporter [Convivina sp. LMG 32447]CAH1851803.1 hypothetical protein R077815_00405 [Convivina sp. LMG 32447]CAH1853889.1 hypothetical protein LMG032447_00737 [Convivina sp. LMG 32447]CAH1854190.1 hypothetical protein R078138_00825 [Convivina sp. LMG 32447]
MQIKNGQWVGIILALVLSLVAMVLANYLPQIGAEGLAMLMGILLGNTIFSGEKYNSGVKWAEKYPIEIGIALLGATLTLKTIAKLGWQGIGFIILNMILVITIVYALGKYIFKVDIADRLLMGAGNAVCGSSAIAAVAPAIGARDNDRRTAVATVSLTGMLLLLTLPGLSQWIFGQNNLLIGALIGGTVQSVGQVVGTAALVNNQVVTYATLFKLLRVIMLALVVVGMAYWARKTSHDEEGMTGKAKITFLPWYIQAFIVLILINSFISLPEPIHQICHTITSFFGVVNLAAIGLNLKWSTIQKSGVKFISYGALVGVIQVILALILIFVFFKMK